MNSTHLKNLVKIRELKIEPPDQKEFSAMLAAAKRGLQDARVEHLSDQGRFTIAYDAAHGLALAALRWHGYRSESRYLVFQCLQHTVGLTTEKWRLLDLCHKQRNLAVYEGHLDISPQLFKELLIVTEELLSLVEALGDVPHIKL